MKKNFVKEMDIKKTIKYENPTIITLSGLPGSGKTTIARKLSKRFGLFILSNDYIRNYYFIKFADDLEKKKKIPMLVARINKKRLARLLINRRSLIIDADLNTQERIEKYEKISDLFKYNIIKIKLESTSDEKNIKRIENRIMDYNYVDNDVVGDNVNYSSSYPKEVYYQIKESKP